MSMHLDYRHIFRILSHRLIAYLYGVMDSSIWRSNVVLSKINIRSPSCIYPHAVRPLVLSFLVGRFCWLILGLIICPTSLINYQGKRKRLNDKIKSNHILTLLNNTIIPMMLGNAWCVCNIMVICMFQKLVIQWNIFKRRRCDLALSLWHGRLSSTNFRSVYLHATL